MSGQIPAQILTSEKNRDTILTYLFSDANIYAADREGKDMEINNNGPEKELEAAGEPAADNAPAEQAAPSGETKKKKK